MDYKFICHRNNYFELVTFKRNTPHKNKFNNISNKNDIYYEKEKERIVISRAQRKFKNYALNNDFQFFVTITIDSIHCNRYSLENALFVLKSAFKEYKRRIKSFIYLIITEQHKDGAYHFHGFIGGLPDNEIYINENLYLDNDFLHNRIGNISIFPFYGDVAFVNYCLKYFKKAPIKSKTNYLYFNSRGLKTAESFILTLDTKFDFTNFPHFFENEHFQYSSFYYNDLTSNEKLDMLYNFSLSKYYIDKDIII